MTEEIKEPIETNNIHCEVCGKKKRCIACYFSKRNSKAGKRGGKVTSERKKLAGQQNALKARIALAKKRSNANEGV